MKYKQRDYPEFSACGLNCGLCPRFYTKGLSRCPGCGGENFLTKHPTCGILSCNQRHGIEYCYNCKDYPCKKYEGADERDSFITHKNQLKDLDKANRIGIDAYKIELKEKVKILEHLLEDYDDGRRKSFFCIAINLLELEDIKSVMEQISDEIRPNNTKKEKAAIAVGLFKEKADERKVLLKLRKKPK